MMIVIDLDHFVDVAKAQREVSNTTNKMLKKNPDALKIATVETAKETERGIVDEVWKIQDEGRIKRQSAEAELLRIKTETRNKLLEMSRQTRPGA